MKQYKENFINPDTGKKEKIQVTEYFYEDYVNGIISAKFSTLGKELHRVLDTNKNIYYEYAIMSRTEYKKIQAEAKRLYEQKVNAEFDLFKTIFLKRYDTSQAKDLLLKNEIELYKKLLFNEYLPISFITDIHTPIELIMPSMEMPDFSKMFAPNGFNPDYKGEKIQYYKPTKLNTRTISEIRETYKRIIIEGVKDYSHTNSPNFRIVIGGGDLHYIRVEAIHLYFEWIKNFKPDTQNPETTFKDLLINCNADEVLAILKENYTKVKSKKMVLMLKALHKIELITINIDNYQNKTEIHNILKVEFLHNNSLSAFTDNIRKLENDVNDEVKPVKGKIEKLLAKLVNK